MPLVGVVQFQSRLRAISDTEALLRHIVIKGVEHANALVPRKTGNLGRTIRPGVVTATTGEILAGGQKGVGYAAHVEFGTKGGKVITPRPGRIGRNGRPAALAWGGPRTLGGRLKKGGKPQFFARSVTRGSTRAQPFLGPGLRKAARDNGVDGIIDAWNRGA